MLMKTIALLGVLVTVSAAAVAQVEPAATGPSRPSGTLNYSVHDSQTAWWSDTLGSQEANSISGIVEYEGGKSRSPLSVSYSGGYTFNLAGSNYDTGYFQSLRATQTISGHKWRLRVSDNLIYLPQAPGFGILGSSDGIGGGPTSGTGSVSVLTENTHTINNMSGVSYSIPINFALSFVADGNLQILRYPGADGVDTTAIFGGGGIAYRFNARTSVGGDIRESRYSYSGSTISFTTTSAVASINHTFGKGISTHASVGPNWVSSSGGSSIPSSTALSIAGGLSYHKRFDSISADYYHGDNGGSGVFYGAQFNSLTASYSRLIEKRTTLSIRFGYVEDSSLQTGVQSGSSRGIFAGASYARRLGKQFSFGASYNATEQSQSGSINGTAFSGLLQGVSVSLGYAPRGMKNIEQR
jgi:hypothetical protein